MKLYMGGGQVHGLDINKGFLTTYGIDNCLLSKTRRIIIGVKLRPISEEYAATFLDDPKYAGRPQHQLQGLAAVIEDTDALWRPSISELIRLLSPSGERNKLLVAGTAYGCAKMIQDEFPGPAILLYGAALNAIGSAPSTELQTAIESAKRTLDDAGLSDDINVKILLNAANERAKFEKVGQMLRDEFSAVIQFSKRYNQAEIPAIVKEIVAVANDVRHKWLIERTLWQHKTKEVGGSDTDFGYIVQLGEIEFVDDRLRAILPPAQVGCAYSIKSRLDQQKNVGQ